MGIALEGNSPIGADGLEAPVTPQHHAVKDGEDGVARGEGDTVDQNRGSGRHLTRRGTCW